MTTTATYNTEYDSQGRVVRLTSPQGTLSYEYDTLGRKTRTYTGDSVSPTDDWRYRYDALGRLSQIQMVRRNGAAVDLDLYTAGIQPEITGYHYDLAGNLDWQDQPTGVQTDYTYDALQRLTSVAHYTQGYFLDDPADGGKLSQFTYTLLADGTRQQLDETLYYSTQTYGAQEVHNTYSWTYDALNRLTDEEFKTNYDTLFTNGQTPPTDGDRPLASHHDHYVFDLAGNRLSKTTDVGVRTTGGAIAFDGNPEEALTYFYDANDRLLREERNFSDTEQSDTVTLYTYQGTQQTHKTVQIGEPVEGTPQWVSQTDFAWDLQGKLGQITSRSYDDTGMQTGGSTADYEYAPSGDRVGSQTEEWAHVPVYGGQVEERVRETNTTYLVDPDNFTGYSQVLKELTSTTTTTTTKLGTTMIGTSTSHNTSQVTSTIGHDVVAQWINGHIAPLAETNDGPPMGMYFNGTTSLLYDGHGSTRQLSVMPYNSSQAALSSWVIQGYVYDAYGQMLGGSAGGALTNLLYSGEQFDQRAAMQYLRARNYDAVSGRFVGLDPFAGNQTDPQRFHKYLYALSNPISGVDPTGWDTSAVGTLTSMTMGGFLSATAAGGVVGALVPTAVGIYQGESADEILAKATRGFLMGAISGGLGYLSGGAVAAYSVSVQTVAAFAGNAFLGGVEGAIESYADGGSFEDMAWSAGTGATFSGLLGIFGLMMGRGATSIRQMFNECCFDPSTIVATSDGRKPIGEIGPGELVKSFDFETSQWCLSEVLTRHDSSYHGTLYSIDIEGEVIRTTHNHPFWVVLGDDLEGRRTCEHIPSGEDEGGALPGRWVDASQLQVGDLVICDDHLPRMISNHIQKEVEAWPVCNLAIRTHHSFAVGIPGILVHNAIWCGVLERITPKPPALVALAESMGYSSSFVHAHHIVEKVYDAVKAMTPNTYDWYIRESQKLITEVGVPLLGETKDEIAKARFWSKTGNREDLVNLCWALNGNGTHTEATAKAVYDALNAGKGSYSEITQVLKRFATKFANGEIIADAL